jgi:hypothetical protein
MTRTPNIVVAKELQLGMMVIARLEGEKKRKVVGLF